MDRDYLQNPAIKFCLEHIVPGSLEKEVQALWECASWTVFPPQQHFMTYTKYKRGDTEPDTRVVKVLQFNAGWSDIDLLIVELKRDNKDKSLIAFNGIASAVLIDHMGQSGNHRNTTLFGAVGIGAWVVFYRKLLPDGDLVTLHNEPLHFEHHADQIQGWFEYFKVNIPGSQNIVSPPNAPHETPQDGPSFSYSDQTSSSSPFDGMENPTAEEDMDEAMDVHKGNSTQETGPA